MASLYIKFNSNGSCVDASSFIILNIFNLSNTNKIINLNLMLTNSEGEDNIKFEFTDFPDDSTLISDAPEVCNYSQWPVLVIGETVISGLCAIARQIVKMSPIPSIRELLGFRDACLAACAESSEWTKFCEIDAVVLMNKTIGTVLPIEVVAFERHLESPVLKAHNIYKLARNTREDQNIKSGIPKRELKIDRHFIEGPQITLVDLIVFLALGTVLKSFIISEKLPLISNWFKKVSETMNIPLSVFKSIDKRDVSVDYGGTEAQEETMTISKKHTKQYKIDEALALAKPVESFINNSNIPFGCDIYFDWNQVPLPANPISGSIPSSRSKRKAEQLENLAKAVIAVNKYRKGTKIVDFCSGSGHLGILIACLLPNCKIVLVENKEMSVGRAQKTIREIGLSNIVIIQSNLQYFSGNFDIGVSLHACGLVTDLVIEKCIKTRADYISCPCCYGKIKTCHQMSYPRSHIYKSTFSENVYFNIAHAADQTHDEDNVKTSQGYVCMDIIDTDRNLYAKGCGYELVYLGKLQPSSCTYKNNLLVGIFDNK